MFLSHFYSLSWLHKHNASSYLWFACCTGSQLPHVYHVQFKTWKLRYIFFLFEYNFSGLASRAVVFAAALISPQNNSNFTAWWQHWDDGFQFGWRRQTCVQVETGSTVRGCHSSYFLRVARVASSFLEAWQALLMFDSQGGTPACRRIRWGVDLEPQITFSINPGFDCFHWLMA